MTIVTGWQTYLHEAAQHLLYFARRQSWQRAVAYIEGLLSSAERKNTWQLAEVNGTATPCGIQHLLGRASWQPDQLRDVLYACVVARLDDPDAVRVRVSGMTRLPFSIPSTPGGNQERRYRPETILPGFCPA